MPPHKEKEPSDPWVECSSPPCFAHELSAVSDGFAVTDPQQARDVSTWRKSTRIDLLARRAAYSTAERHLFEQRLGTHLLNVLDELRLTDANKILSGYWPIKSELNLLSVFLLTPTPCFLYLIFYIQFHLEILTLLSFYQ